MQGSDGLYIVLISVHGLVRGRDMELGRDADTGGQVKYVVELARALACHPEVRRVDLLTRLVKDAKVDDTYTEPVEELASGARIIRLPCGPKRYLRKEVLWPHLDSFTDQALQHIRRVGRVPDVVHGHYADGGYIGSKLAGLLNIPFVLTGHSLGRCKRQRLLDRGLREEAIESQYNMQQRIEAEEAALDNAAFVVASTHQEVEEQYSLYDNYTPGRMKVIAPGVEVERFRPPSGEEPRTEIRAEIERFLREPEKPMILAISRADPRKNIGTLVKAYGSDERLRELANLVVIAGNREEIEDLDKGAREVITELLHLVDRFDLYGSVAYPKTHRPSDVPDLYRLAAATRGVFVNPALTEPFGLTLIEAAASGLPIVATDDGGPRDIIRACENGVLVDALDPDAMSRALRETLEDRERWERWSQNGVAGAHEHFSWKSHVEKYLEGLRRLVGPHRRRIVKPSKSRLPTIDRLLISDIDNTLIGDREGLDLLLARLEGTRGLGFGVATGRSLERTLQVLEEWGVPSPDVLLTSVGTEIHYGAELTPDRAWTRQIDYRWRPDDVREAMAGVRGVRLQPDEDQRPHKISYFHDPDDAPSARQIRRLLRQKGLEVKLIFSHGEFLDVLPVRASKGHSLRYFAWRWGIPLHRIVVCGDSGNDAEMLQGETLAVVVANHSRELARLRDRSGIYFAKGAYAHGVLEGLEEYRFLETARVPREAVEVRG